MAGGGDPEEPLSPCAAVLLFDQSESMSKRGYHTATKDAAVALNSLIREQYRQIALHVVPFSYFARVIRPEALLGLTWNAWGYGTSLQIVLEFCRQLLADHPGARQILLITDGEPTGLWSEDGTIE